MNIYIILWIVTVACYLLEVNITTLKIEQFKLETRKISFIVLYLFILLMGIFRDELLGVDVINYKMHFYQYGEMDYLDLFSIRGLEPGYVILNKIIYLFTDDFWMFEAILYFITFSIFSFVIYKVSRYPSFSYLIYIGFGFLGFNFCILRQALAVSICFYAFRFVKEKKIIKFILCVLLASMFHITAIGYLLSYPLANFKLQKNVKIKKEVYIVCFSILFFIFMPTLVDIFKKGNYSLRMIIGEGMHMLAFNAVLVFLISCFLRLKKITDLKMEYDLSVMIVYIQIGALFFSLFTRMNYYWMPIITILIPNLIKRYEKKFLISVTLAAPMSFLYFFNLFLNETQIVPYVSIFEMI